MGIEARNLRKVYNDRAVVNGVNFKVDQGEVVGVSQYAQVGCFESHDL